MGRAAVEMFDSLLGKYTETLAENIRLKASEGMLEGQKEMTRQLQSELARVTDLWRTEKIQDEQRVKELKDANAAFVEDREKARSNAEAHREECDTCFHEKADLQETVAELRKEIRRLKKRGGK